MFVIQNLIWDPERYFYFYFLDSSFRWNDIFLRNKKPPKQVIHFTPSPLEGEGWDEG